MIAQTIRAGTLDHKSLNILVKDAAGDVCIEDCYGQRFIGSGIRGKSITINGTPGNALGAYLDGGIITVSGNAQDATGDTMNDGKIIVHGSAGDALGYAMRGGMIFVRDSAGYRTGIHMKEYRGNVHKPADSAPSAGSTTGTGSNAAGSSSAAEPADIPVVKMPVIVVGGSVGSFLGEYMAGGIIIVLGIGSQGIPIGDFAGTGMHGGRIYIRTDCNIENLPAQVTASAASNDDIADIVPYITEFAGYFDMTADELLGSAFHLLRPNAKNPYKQLYTAN